MTLLLDTSELGTIRNPKLSVCVMAYSSAKRTTSPALNLFKNISSRGDSEFQTAASCDYCDAASWHDPELVPFAVDEFTTDTVPDQLEFNRRNVG